MKKEFLKTFHIRTRIKQFFQNRGVKFRSPKPQKFLDKSFFLHGKIRADYDTGWAIELSRNANVIFDVGCNIGMNAVLFNQFSSVNKIYLFEPNISALSLAVENSILNGFSEKIRIFNYCISNENNKILKFYSVLEGAAGSLHRDFSHTANDLNSFYDVRTITIDKICEDENVIPDLIKVDVEGHEYQVLEGSTKTALKGKTKFLVEMHSSKILSMEENSNKLLEWAKKINYRVIYLKKMRYITDSNLVKDRGRCHLLCVPDDFILGKRLKSIKQSELNAHF